MCGIAGFAGPELPGNKEQCESILHSMGRAIQHRGPDAGGVWFDGELGLGPVSYTHLTLPTICSV